MLILISMLCYVMLYYSKVLKFFVVGGGGFKISPRAPTELGPALLTGRKHRENIYFNTFSRIYIVG